MTHDHATANTPADACEPLDPTLTRYLGHPAWIGIAWRPKDHNHPYYDGLKDLLEEHEREDRERTLRTYTNQLPSRYRHYTLDRLRQHPGNQTAIHAATNLTLGTNLYLWGPAGNGKTHLAVATGHHLAQAGHHVTFWGVVELFNTLRSSFSTSGPRPDLDRPEILILDDLGKIKPTEFVYETFYGAIEHRWANEKTTIFTANHRPSDAAKHLSTDPESAAAILSRMASGTVIEIRGRDERLPA